MSHTVKHNARLAAYDVRDAAGELVARYAYDAEDFQARRRAYREALEDAAVRDEAAAQVAGYQWAEQQRAA